MNEFEMIPLTILFHYLNSFLNSKIIFIIINFFYTKQKQTKFIKNFTFFILNP